MNKSALLLSLTLLLSGCVTTMLEPSHAQVEEMVTAPFPADAAVQIHRVLKYHLLDYDSAKIELGEVPEKSFSIVYNRGRTAYGWRLAGAVNSKNRLGGYVGWKQYEFFFEHGRLVMMQQVLSSNNRQIVWKF